MAGRQCFEKTPKVRKVEDTHRLQLYFRARKDGHECQIRSKVEKIEEED